MTSNEDACRSFYARLFGWTPKEQKMGPMTYTMFHAGGEPVGGMMAAQGGAPSAWLAYVAVENVDAKAKEVGALGGKVVVPPTDVPNVGRFCVFVDPSGAALAMITLK
jgi:hypothetical protein